MNHRHRFSPQFTRSKSALRAARVWAGLGSLLLFQPIGFSAADDLRIIREQQQHLPALTSAAPWQYPSGGLAQASAPPSNLRQATVRNAILLSWSIPEPELAKLFAYAYTNQLPLLLQGFNAEGQEASIRANQLRVAQLISEYHLRGIPQVWIDERRFHLLTYPQVPVLVQLEQRQPTFDLSNPQLVSHKPQLRLLYQQYGNVSLEALAQECHACVRRQQLQQQLSALELPSAPYSQSSLVPQPDITQVGTGGNLALAFRPQETLPRDGSGSDPFPSHSSSLNSSPISLSAAQAAVAELHQLSSIITPPRVLGKVYPIVEQAFSALARERLAQAQHEGKLNFTQVRQQTPLTLLEQTRALKTPTLVGLRNRLENQLRDLTARSASLAARVEQLRSQGATNYRAWERDYPLSHLEQQWHTLQTQQHSLQRALRELAEGNYPLMAAQHLHQVDLRPERNWQLPPDLLRAAQTTSPPLLHGLLIFVDLTHPQLQALLKEYFVEWHWLISQQDAVVIVTDIERWGEAELAARTQVVAQDSSTNREAPAGSSAFSSHASRGEATAQAFRSAFNYWLGRGQQVLLFNESLSASFNPTAFTTVQQATTHDLVATNLTLAQELRGKLLVRDWSLQDLEQWLGFIRSQREAELRSF